MAVDKRKAVFGKFRVALPIGPAQPMFDIFRGANPTLNLLKTVRVEVRNFYPWLRGSGRFARFGAWLYGQTQLRIHVIVCNGFLRSLARLNLPPSRVGALAAEIDAR